MQIKLIRDQYGEAYSAVVALTERERLAVLSNNVPLIYSPGGMGPDRPVESNTVRFGGACYVDTEQCLLACLDAFRAAIKAEFKRAAYWRQISQLSYQDEQIGFDAFPSGRFADAMRGTKSFPDYPRCPFRDRERVSSWWRGYERAHAAILESFAEA